MRVREADLEDATAIHALGSNAPELAVGGVGGGFPSRDDLEDVMFDGSWWALEDDAGIIWGFCCVQINDRRARRARPLAGSCRRVPGFPGPPCSASAARWTRRSTALG